MPFRPAEQRPVLPLTKRLIGGFAIPYGDAGCLMQGDYICTVFKRFVIPAALLLLSASSGISQSRRGELPASTPSAAADSFRTEVFEAAAGTWGYDIYRNGQRYIHQPLVPGQPGAAGFSSAARARKAAAIACQKLRSGIVPPTITTAELRAANLID